MGFKMNLGAFEFIKLKKKSSKDEIFAMGFIMGMRHSYELFAQMNDVPEEEVVKVVDEVLDHSEIEAVWNELAEVLELDLRDPKIVGLIKH